MTTDDDLDQRVQIVQHRILETALSEARAGERDPAPELVQEKVRFAERVEEQTPEGTVVTHSQSTTSSSSSSSSSSSISSPTTIAASMQVDESDQDSSKKTESQPWNRYEIEGAGYGV